MLEELQALLDLAGRIPVAVGYVLLGLGAAVENVFPPMPSDTFVLLGAILSSREVMRPEIVLAAAWTGNVSGALFVYFLGRRYGRGVFEGTPWGRWLLRPHQLERLGRFYDRYGPFTIFLFRFLPVFRVVDPVFAGITGLRFWKAAIPLALASLVWYGILLYLGMLLTRNLHRVGDLFGHLNTGLLVAAGAVALLVLAAWWRTRRRRHDSR